MTFLFQNDRQEDDKTMRYDDYDDYSSRSGRGSSRRSSSSYSGGRDYDRDYDRGYYQDRDYRSDFGREYDRGYYERDRYEDRYGDRYGDRYDDRYSTRVSRDPYRDFDRSDWERTAPNWDRSPGSRREDQGSRRRSSGSSGSSRSRSSQSSRSGSRRPPENTRRRSDRDDRRRDDRRRENNRKGAVQILPIVVGLVVIVLAALVIRSMLGGKGDYEIKVSDEIVVGETAEATLTGSKVDKESTEVEWTSKDSNVISVEGDGTTCTLTAESLGRATIVATVDGETAATRTVTVVETATGVTEIRVTQDSITVRSGETYTISATVVMEEGKSPAGIKWSSADSSVATVDDSGVVTARDVGKTIVKGVAGDKTVEVYQSVLDEQKK